MASDLVPPTIELEPYGCRYLTAVRLILDGTLFSAQRRALTGSVVAALGLIGCARIVVAPGTALQGTATAMPYAAVSPSASAASSFFPTIGAVTTDVPTPPRAAVPEAPPPSVDVGASSNGESINVRLGTTISVDLAASANPPYSWTVATSDAPATVRAGTTRGAMVYHWGGVATAPVPVQQRGITWPS
jgi:hypothetical protein